MYRERGEWKRRWSGREEGEKREWEWSRREEGVGKE